MACHPHDADDLSAPHDPDSAAVTADAWALVKAHLEHDDEAVRVILGLGCPACIATLAAGLLARYLEDVIRRTGRDPAGLAEVAAQMSRHALSSDGD
jgi:hypothetical protein